MVARVIHKNFNLGHQKHHSHLLAIDLLCGREIGYSDSAVTTTELMMLEVHRNEGPRYQRVTCTQ